MYGNQFLFSSTAYLSKARKTATLEDTRNESRKVLGSLILNSLPSSIPPTDSNTGNVTKYIKRARTAGFFMQSLRSSVNKETNEVPGHYKCPTEKLR